MKIKKLELVDKGLLQAIQWRYELLHGLRGDDLTDVEFDLAVRNLERVIAFKLCEIFGAVLMAGVK